MEAVLRHDRSSHGDDLGDRLRLQAVREVLEAMVPTAAEEIGQVSATVLPEFNEYGELIAAVDAPVAGLLVRGEGEEFTRRVSALMERWGMTDEAQRYHLYLADCFEHVYNAIVQDKRVTNYSLYGHPEFFAEMYEVYYEGGAGAKRGEKLKGVPNWKQFFDTTVHPTVMT